MLSTHQHLTQLQALKNIIFFQQAIFFMNKRYKLGYDNVLQ